MWKRITKYFISIYQRRYHGVYRHAKKLFFFDLALLGMTIALLATSITLIFWKPGVANFVDLSISLGNERIKSGENTKVEIKYSNRSELELRDVVLGIKFPRGFIVDTKKIPDKYNINDKTTSIGTVQPGAESVIDFYGQFWAEPEVNEQFSALLSFNTDKYNRREQRVVSFFARLPESILSNKYSMPEYSLPGKIINVSLATTNTGNEKIGLVKFDRLELNNLSSFDEVVMTRSGRKLTAKENSEKIFSLWPGETVVATAEWKTPEKVNEVVFPFSFAVGLPNGPTISQRYGIPTMKILHPEIVSRANIESNQKFYDANEELPIKIYWKNNSDVALKNLRLNLKLSPAGIIDLKKTATQNPNWKLINNELVADENTQTDFKNPTKGIEGYLNITLITAKDPRWSDGTNGQLTITPTLSAITTLGGENLYEAIGGSAKAEFTGTPKFNLQARYFTAEGDQLGRGPLPPIVGETTKYWIFAQIINSVHEIGNTNFEAKLAPGVNFTGKQSVTLGNELKYNETNRTVSWEHNSIPAHGIVGIYFEVAVTPSPMQIGQKIKLIESYKFNAVDNLTEKNFDLQGGAINNSLLSNDRGANLGATVEAQ